MTTEAAREVLRRAGLLTSDGRVPRLASIRLERLGASQLELRFSQVRRKTAEGGPEVYFVSGLPEGEYCTIFTRGVDWTINYFVDGHQIYLDSPRSEDVSLTAAFEEFKLIRRALDHGEIQGD